MAWSKAKIAVITGAGVLLAAGVTTAVFEFKAQAELKNDPVAYELLHRSLWQRAFPEKVDAEKLRQQLVGTWVIEAKKFRNDRNYNRFSDANRLKTWTETNWSIVTYDAQSNVIYSASGPYELKGDYYTETIAEATGTMASYVGAHPEFRIRVDGDKYYQRGLGDKPNLEEIGHRIQEAP